MAKKIDLTGRKFGRWFVVEEVSQKKRQRRWLCQCECGNVKEVIQSTLTRGASASCGCMRNEKVAKKVKLNLTGKKFGLWSVIKENGRNKHGQVLWECKCECGNVVNVVGSFLKRGVSQGCGCSRNKKISERTKIGLVDRKFGRLTVLKDVGSDEQKRILWLCQCECGNKIEVSGVFLRRGTTKSCGCLKLENKGEKHHRYNPNLTDEERGKHRYAFGDENVHKWRVSVFLRDGCACQNCGDKQEKGNWIKINAHHLDGWNWCKEKRFDVDNGITLCKDCHTDFHKKYGSGNNTRQQFEEYASSFKQTSEYEQLTLF